MLSVSGSFLPFSSVYFRLFPFPSVSFRFLHIDAEFLNDKGGGFWRDYFRSGLPAHLGQLLAVWSAPAV